MVSALSGSVILNGVTLSEHRVDDLLAFYEAREQALEAEQVAIRRAHADLWSARCDAYDQRQNMRAA